MVAISPFEIEVVSKIIIAALLGATLGLERELRKTPADVRTTSLVCLGAALFGILGSISDSNGTPLYPFVASGVVTGIGFLGAGMIFRDKDKVHGLTTAAEVWTLGAIGLSTGLGLYGIAIATTIVVLLVQLMGREFEKITLRKK